MLVWRLSLPSRAAIHPHRIFFQQAYAFTLDCCRRRQATVLTLRPSAHHHKLCFGKFDTHDPTLPLVLEVRAIRAPHQDEPQIGQCRWGGWVIRAFAPRQTTTPMLPFERKASPSCIGRAVIVNSRISCFAWLASRPSPTCASARRPALPSSRIKPGHRSPIRPHSVLVSRFLIYSNGGYSDWGHQPRFGHPPMRVRQLAFRLGRRVRIRELN